MTTLTWEEIAAATGPGDDVESAVRQAYREAGLAEPERVVVLPSPAAGAVAVAWLTGDQKVLAALTQAGLKPVAELEGVDAGGPEGVGPGGPEGVGPAGPEGVDPGKSEGVGSGSFGAFDLGSLGAFDPASLGAFDPGSLEGIDPGSCVREVVRTAPWERARAAAHRELGPTGWAAHWSDTGGRLWPQVNRIVTDIRRAVADLGGEGLRRITLDAVLGQHDAPWLSAFDGLDGLKRVAGGAGWWWPFERLAVVTERPVELHLDDLGRLHRADGPALLYADGFALHAWHGMPVPEDFGATMGDITPAAIRAQENAELRRAMLEHFGMERYLAESGARPRHSDDTGVLWRIDLPDDEPIVMVEVVNSTPEPDGTRRTYFLRVPPWVQRARQGVAWTFGVPEEHYHPERET
ncbi:hypothetical protein HII36_54580 [Nonomuraea sp. NN258]|uniref:DUF6745 domain-containing protein n=1 Tax=Nonomuraea antri TaxID=2730852 RepID=UPI001567CD64|nr:hypothetical protein [Nonomuraea antri]NRQ40776.1 hypothetical protein [Nonomuraea antri]